MTIAEKIERAMLDYSAVHDAGYGEGYTRGENYGIEQGKISILDESKYMHPTVSGSVIAVNDVNSMEHSLGVKVASKNLVNFPVTSVIRNKWENSGTIFGTEFVDVSHLRGKTITYQALINLTNIDENNASHYVTSNGECSVYGCVMIWLYNPNGTVINAYSGNDIVGCGNVGISKKTVQVPDVEGVMATFGGRTSFYGYSTTEALGEDYIELSNPMVELGSTATIYTPYITDFSGTKVTGYGKNLFDISNPLTAGYNAYTLEEYPIIINNEIIYSAGQDGNAEGEGIYIPVPIPNTPISISFDVEYDETETDRRFRVRGFNNVDETTRLVSDYSTIIGEVIDSNKVKIENIITDKKYILITWWSKNRNGMRISNLQFELNPIVTEYEPYNGQTATATKDGIVEGLTSVSHNMVLIPDTESVTIDCEYYRDIDAYIDNLMMNVALTGGE